MQIILKNAGKRFNREWIFRHIDFEFIPFNSYAITGHNGSGKSTLLQLLAGALHKSEGTIEYYEGMAGSKREIKDQEFFKKISFVAPYLELIEEMTAIEILEFHARFKTLTIGIPTILTEVGLQNSAHKQIRYFSSGMKQRLKLAMGFFTDAPVIFLDEPTTNLDEEGNQLFHRLISDHSRQKLVIISSNDPAEYHFCEHILRMENYKI